MHNLLDFLLFTWRHHPFFIVAWMIVIVVTIILLATGQFQTVAMGVAMGFLFLIVRLLNKEQ